MYWQNNARQYRHAFLAPCIVFCRWLWATSVQNPCFSSTPVLRHSWPTLQRPTIPILHWPFFTGLLLNKDQILRFLSEWISKHYMNRQILTHPFLTSSVHVSPLGLFFSAAHFNYWLRVVLFLLWPLGCGRVYSFTTIDRESDGKYSFVCCRSAWNVCDTCVSGPSSCYK